MLEENHSLHKKLTYLIGEKVRIIDTRIPGGWVGARVVWADPKDYMYAIEYSVDGLKTRRFVTGEELDFLTHYGEVLKK